MSRTYGEILSQLRKRSGLSQEQFVNACVELANKVLSAEEKAVLHEMRFEVPNYPLTVKGKKNGEDKPNEYGLIGSTVSRYENDQIDEETGRKIRPSRGRTLFFILFFARRGVLQLDEANEWMNAGVGGFLGGDECSAIFGVEVAKQYTESIKAGMRKQLGIDISTDDSVLENQEPDTSKASDETPKSQESNSVTIEVSSPDEEKVKAVSSLVAWLIKSGTTGNIRILLTIAIILLAALSIRYSGRIYETLRKIVEHSGQREATPTPIATFTVAPTSTPTETPIPLVVPVITGTLTVTPTVTVTSTVAPTSTPTVTPASTQRPSITPTRPGAQQGAVTVVNDASRTTVPSAGGATPVIVPPTAIATQSKLTATQTATATPAPATATLPPASPMPGSIRTNSVDEAVYVYVPSGNFFKVQGEGNRKSYWKSTEAFWIMQTEVTNGQYARCVQAEKCFPPGNNIWSDSSMADHPVTHVSYSQATAYARWVGGRLPTRDEWEKACGRTNNSLYPWGNDKPNASRARFASNSTVSVKSYSQAGASPYGAMGMIGNVWEWTTSQFQNVNDGQPDLKRKTVKGGAFDNAPAESESLKCYYTHGVAENDQSPTAGFRVVLDAP